MKALIVEDKAPLADAVKDYLKMKKVDTIVRYDGMEGYKEALVGNFDVMILDLMLPGKDGFSIIKDLRANKIETPILVLSAKSSTEDKVECLLAGADDYLTKPFVLEELLARLLTLTRRKGNIIPNEITFGDIRLNKLTHALSRGELSVSLSLKEYQIMEILMTNSKKIVEKDFIISKVWNSKDDRDYNSAEVYVSFLRKKLVGLKAESTIRSVRNLGYKLVEKTDEN